MFAKGNSIIINFKRIRDCWRIYLNIGQFFGLLGEFRKRFLRSFVTPSGVTFISFVSVAKWNGGTHSW